MKYYTHHCSDDLKNPDGSDPWRWGQNRNDPEKYKTWIYSALNGVESSKKEGKYHKKDISYFRNNINKLCREVSNLSSCFHQLNEIVVSKRPEWEQISMIMNLRDHRNRPFIDQETAKDIYDTMHMKYIQRGRGSDFDEHGEPYCIAGNQEGGKSKTSTKKYRSHKKRAKDRRQRYLRYRKYGGATGEASAEAQADIKKTEIDEKKAQETEQEQEQLIKKEAQLKDQQLKNNENLILDQANTSLAEDKKEKLSKGQRAKNLLYSGASKTLSAGKTGAKGLLSGLGTLGTGLAKGAVAGGKLMASGASAAASGVANLGSKIREGGSGGRGDSSSGEGGIMSLSLIQKNEPTRLPG